MDPARIGNPINDKPVYHMDDLDDFIRKNGVSIGIIAVPARYAQDVCDRLISTGIKAIWNFAPKHLDVPEGILVQSENMAASLAVLSKHLSERMEMEKEQREKEE